MPAKAKKDDRRRVLVAVPAAIKQAAAGGAAENMNDEIVGQLADHYGVAFDPTGRRGGEVKVGDGKLLLRMPSSLKRKITQEALRRESNMTDVICEVLAERYGVNFEPRNARSVPFGGGAR